MCFDDTILSAYFDGELEGVWKDRVSEHLSVCPVCSAKVVSFGKLQHVLREYKMPDVTFRKNAVLERIHHSLASERELGFWYRKVYLSKTAVVTAAVSLLFIGISLFVLNVRKNPVAADVAEGRPSLSSSPLEVMSSDNMDRVIRYLNSQDKPVEITIDLPLDHRFQYLGEPRFLKEADFTRGR